MKELGKPGLLIDFHQHCQDTLVAEEQSLLHRRDSWDIQLRNNEGGGEVLASHSILKLPRIGQQPSIGAKTATLLEENVGVTDSPRVRLGCSGYGSSTSHISYPSI